MFVNKGRVYVCEQRLGLCLRTMVGFMFVNNGWVYVCEQR